MVRTLVLFDGQRVVTSNPNSGGPPAIGGVDLSTIPSSVIERVDVVTGGASAAWGSDAVAGVVNLVINKHFSGFKANVDLSATSSHNDHKSYKFEVVTGTDFLGGRGHTEFAANYTMSPDAMYNWNRPWYDHANRALYSCAVVNGGTATALCHTPSGVYTNSFTNGGLIVGQCGRATPRNARRSRRSAANSRRSDAALPRQPMRSGASSSWDRMRSRCRSISASTTSRRHQCGRQQLLYLFGQCRHRRGQRAARPRCRITTTICSAIPATSSPTDITASLMLNYGWNAEENHANNGRQANYTIKVDNAFIPAALQQQMIAQGIPSLTLGSAAIENLTNHTDVSMTNLSKSIAQNYVQNYRQLYARRLHPDRRLSSCSARTGRGTPMPRTARCASANGPATTP